MSSREGSAVENRHRHHAVAAAAGRACGQTASGCPELGRAALWVHVNPLGLPHPSAAAGARRAALPPRRSRRRAPGSRGHRATDGRRQRCGWPQVRLTTVQLPHCSTATGSPVAGRRNCPTVIIPPSLLPPGKEEGDPALSVSLRVYGKWAQL
jgi:hypothetical protein